MIAGSNVVDAGRQSFTPATNPDITVHGQFHDLTVTGYDALLGYGTGAEAVITFPDGTVQTEPLDSNDAAVFPRLPARHLSGPGHGRVVHRRRPTGPAFPRKYRQRAGDQPRMTWPLCWARSRW